MFTSQSSPNYDDSGSSLSSKPKALLLAAAAAVILGGLALAFWFYSSQANKPVTPVASTATSSASSSLPGLPDSQVKNASSTATSTEDFYVEYLNFGNYYQAPDNNFTVKINDYALPINVKTAVLNYYDVSRKLDLDSSLNNLKTNGFAIIPSPAPEVANFYSAYDFLNKNKIPPLVTSDFLLYYYQNTLKKAFKDVEGALFYKNLWEINQQLFAGARARYEARLAQVGAINDPILESERLAAAYFAASLELLQPTPGQIAPDNSAPDPTKFTSAEAQAYAFELPDYLKVDVNREVDLIRSGTQTIKSPVLLYARNYRDFNVPAEYRDDSKLNNFYLTTKWLNSNFPLFYKDVNCPDCALDGDDWRISFTTASFIAQDLFDNYTLKNKWARVYKVLAFFKGLRSDFTYVQYRDALVQLFGGDYTLVDVFGSDNSWASENLKKFRDQLLTVKFSQIDGRYDPAKAEDRPNIGVKMLAESYWPNDYIFDQLLTPPLGNFNGTTTAANNVTYCRTGDNLMPRCSGFALDIINMIYPLAPGNPYWRENTDYEGYAAVSGILRDQIMGAGVWQNNNYWSTLKTLNSYLSADTGKQPVFARSAAWKDRQVSAAVGAWVNLQLPIDKLAFSQSYNATDASAKGGNFLDYAYVEPNLPLVNELIARAEMVNQMFALLKINDELKFTASDLNDFITNLKTLKSIEEKELNSTVLSQDDAHLIERLGRQYSVAAAGAKTLSLPMNMNQTLNEDLSGIRLMVLTQKRGGDLVFAVGPVFNYSEHR